MAKINVVHVIESLEMGGAENVVANIVNHTSDEFHSTVCCVKRSGPVAQLIRKDADVVVIGKGEGNSAGLPFKLAALLREKKAGVLHVHNWGAFCESAVAGMLAKTPVRLQMSHGGFHNYPPGAAFRPVKESLRHSAEKILSYGMDAFIAVSEKMRDEVVEKIGIPARKITVIRNGVDIAAASPQKTEERKKELGVKPGENVIGSVGRLVLGKNYSFLIDCFTAIKQQSGADLKLFLIGDGPERRQLEELVDKLGLKGQVFILGERHDARDWLPLADVFVLPSLYEGVSIAMLEAMAAKRPVVALRVGGNPEIVKPGETGFLLDNGDRTGFIAAIAGLLRDDAMRAAMGEKAQQLVRERYSLQETVKRYEALYRGAKS